MNYPGRLESHHLQIANMSTNCWFEIINPAMLLDPHDGMLFNLSPLPGYLPPPLWDHRVCVTKVRSPETHSSHKKSLCATFWLSILWSISKLGRYWCNACLGQRKSTGGREFNEIQLSKKRVAEASVEGGGKHAGRVVAGQNDDCSSFQSFFSVEGPLKLDNKYSSKHPTISMSWTQETATNFLVRLVWNPKDLSKHKMLLC